MSSVREGVPAEASREQALQKLRAQHPAGAIVLSEDKCLAYVRTGAKEAPFKCYGLDNADIDPIKALSDKNFLLSLRGWLTETSPFGTTYVFLNQSPTKGGIEIKASKHFPGQEEGKPHYLELKLERESSNITQNANELDSAINSAVIKLIESRISFSSLLRLSEPSSVILPDALYVAPAIIPFRFIGQGNAECPFIAYSNLKEGLTDPKSILDSPAFRDHAANWMNEKGLSSATFYIDTWQEENGGVKIWTGARSHTPERRACVLELKDSNGDGKIDSYEYSPAQSAPEKILELADQSLQGQAYSKICSFLGVESSYSSNFSAKTNESLEKLKEAIAGAFDEIKSGFSKETAESTGKFAITGIGPDGKTFNYTTEQLGTLDALERNGSIVLFIGSYDHKNKKYNLEANSPTDLSQNGYLAELKEEFSKEIVSQPTIIPNKKQEMPQDASVSQNFTYSELAAKLVSDIEGRISRYDELTKRQGFGPLDEKTSSGWIEDLNPYIERLRFLLDSAEELARTTPNEANEGKLAQSLFEAALGFQTLDSYARASSWKLDVCSTFGMLTSTTDEINQDAIHLVVQNKDELIKEMDAAVGSLNTLMRRLDALTINGGAEADFIDSGDALDLLKNTRETMRKLQETKNLLSVMPTDTADNFQATNAYYSLWSATLTFIETEKSFSKVIGESATGQQVDRWGSGWRKFTYHAGTYVDYGVMALPTAGGIIGGLVTEGAGAPIGAGIGQALESAWFAIRGIDGIIQSAETNNLLSLECAQSLLMASLSFAKLPGLNKLPGVRPAGSILGYGFMGTLGYTAYEQFSDVQSRGGHFTKGDKDFFIGQAAFLLYGSGVSRMGAKIEANRLTRELSNLPNEELVNRALSGKENEKGIALNLLKKRAGSKASGERAVETSSAQAPLATKTPASSAEKTNGKLSELSIEHLGEIIRKPDGDILEKEAAIEELGRRDSPEARATLNDVANLKSLGAASPYDYLDPKLRKRAGELAKRAEAEKASGPNGEQRPAEPKKTEETSFPRRRKPKVVPTAEKASFKEQKALYWKMASEDMGAYRQENAAIRKAITAEDAQAAVKDVAVFMFEGADPAFLMDGYLQNMGQFRSFHAFMSFITDSNLPFKAAGCFKEMQAVLTQMNGGKPYDFLANKPPVLSGQNQVCAVKVEGKSYVIKFANCGEDVLGKEVFEIIDLQKNYAMTQYADFAIIERVKGDELLDVLNEKLIYSPEGNAFGLSVEVTQQLSREMGRQMAAHYAFTFEDYTNLRNFIATIENGKVKVTRIDFEDFETRPPSYNLFQIVCQKAYEGNWLNEAQFEQGFKEMWSSIISHDKEIMNAYEKHFDQLAFTQSEKPIARKAKTKDQAIADVSEKMKMSAEEALASFK